MKFFKDWGTMAFFMCLLIFGSWFAIKFVIAFAAWNWSNIFIFQLGLVRGYLLFATGAGLWYAIDEVVVVEAYDVDAYRARKDAEMDDLVEKYRPSAPDPLDPKEDGIEYLN